MTIQHEQRHLYRELRDILPPLPLPLPTRTPLHPFPSRIARERPYAPNLHGRNVEGVSLRIDHAYSYGWN